MLDFQAPSFEWEEEGKEEEEEIPSPHHAISSYSSFMETYPHFSAWQYEVMNLDGTYSSMPLDRLEHTLNVLWLDPVSSWIIFFLSLFLFGSLNGLWFGIFVLQVDVDLVEEIMQMIRGLQLLACTQSSQYVINKVSWVCNVLKWARVCGLNCHKPKLITKYLLH